jgi:hypothetical protein
MSFSYELRLADGDDAGTFETSASNCRSLTTDEGDEDE